MMAKSQTYDGNEKLTKSAPTSTPDGRTYHAKRDDRAYVKEAHDYAEEKTDKKQVTLQHQVATAYYSANTLLDEVVSIIDQLEDTVSGKSEMSKGTTGILNQASDTVATLNTLSNRLNKLRNMLFEQD